MNGLFNSIVILWFYFNLGLKLNSYYKNEICSFNITFFKSYFLFYIFIYVLPILVSVSYYIIIFFSNNPSSIKNLLLSNVNNYWFSMWLIFGMFIISVFTFATLQLWFWTKTYSQLNKLFDFSIEKIISTYLVIFYVYIVKIWILKYDLVLYVLSFIIWITLIDIFLINKIICKVYIKLCFYWFYIFLSMSSVFVFLFQRTSMNILLCFFIWMIIFDLLQNFLLFWITMPLKKQGEDNIQFQDRLIFTETEISESNKIGYFWNKLFYFFTILTIFFIIFDYFYLHLSNWLLLSIFFMFFVVLGEIKKYTLIKT